MLPLQPPQVLLREHPFGQISYGHGGVFQHRVITFLEGIFNDQPDGPQSDIAESLRQAV